MEHDIQYAFSATFPPDLNEPSEKKALKVCLDKWLWAARFFKTRAVARDAIEKGKVFYNGELPKPGRGMEIGAKLHISQGRFSKIVIVKGLATRRRNTEDALQLFEEKSEGALFLRPVPTLE